MPKVLIDGQYVDVSSDALFADDGQTPLNIPTGQIFTSADIERVRGEEKDKLYSSIETLKTEIGSLKGDLSGLTAAEQQRLHQAEEERKAAEAEARRLETEELSAKDLIAKREQEWNEQIQNTEATWNNRLEEERQARLASEAAREKEREFNNLRDYARNQVEANQDNIAPQLLGWIQGNSTEEIDAAIARAVQTTAEILAEIAPLQQQVPVGPDGQPLAPQQFAPPQPPALPGTRVTMAPGEDPTTQFQQMTAEQIAQMPMDKYAVWRQQQGIGSQATARGLYG